MVLLESLFGVMLSEDIAELWSLHLNRSFIPNKEVDGSVHCALSSWNVTSFQSDRANSLEISTPKTVSQNKIFVYKLISSGILML